MDETDTHPPKVIAYKGVNKVPPSQSFCCDHQIQLLWTEAWLQAITLENIVGRFRKIGVYLLILHAYLLSGLNGGKSNSTNTSDSSDSSRGEDPLDGYFDQGGNEKEEIVFGNDLSSTPTGKEDSLTI